MKKITLIFISIFVTLLIASAVVGTITKTENKTSTQDEKHEARLCQNLVPGLMKICRGADISVLDLLPVDTKAAKDLRRSIFNFTCTERKQWTNPYNNVTYDLPDQISTINSLPFSIFETRYSFDKDFESTKRTMAVDVGIDYKQGMFSGSASYKKNLVSMLNQSTSIASVDSFFSAFQADLKPYWSSEMINQEFFKFITKDLPSTYYGNEDKYDELFQTFGTHFFSSGHFGGMYRITFELNQNLLRTMPSTEIEANAKAKFISEIAGLTGDFSYNKGNMRISEHFNGNSKIIKKQYGGNIFNVEDRNYEEWVRSIPRDPWLFGGYLKPISYIFPDSVAYKKNETDMAAIVYLDKAYLADIKIILEQFSGKVIEKEIGKKLISQVVELQKDKVPNHENVTQIRESVDKYLKTARNTYGRAKIEVRKASVRDSNIIFKLSPYCVVFADGKEIGRTRAARKTSSPSWFTTFTTHYINVQSSIQFCVWDKNVLWSDKQIGCGSTTVQNIIDKNLEGKPSTENSFRDNWFEVTISWMPKE